MKTLITKRVVRRMRRFPKTNDAVSALEYAVPVSVIAVAIGAGLVAFSGSIATSFQ